MLMKAEQKATSPAQTEANPNGISRNSLLQGAVILIARRNSAGRRILRTKFQPNVPENPDAGEGNPLGGYPA
jgi:hypothetical protein